jgi:hypothetical protein
MHDLLPPSVLGGRITGKATVTCEPRPESHTMQVGIEQRTGAGWDTYGRPKITADIPDAAGLLVQVLVPCVPGTYRVRVRVAGTGSLPTRLPFDVVEYSAPTRVDTC